MNAIRQLTPHLKNIKEFSALIQEIRELFFKLHQEAAKSNLADDPNDQLFHVANLLSTTPEPAIRTKIRDLTHLFIQKEQDPRSTLMRLRNLFINISLTPIQQHALLDMALLYIRHDIDPNDAIELLHPLLLKASNEAEKNYLINLSLKMAGHNLHPDDLFRILDQLLLHVENSLMRQNIITAATLLADRGIDPAHLFNLINLIEGLENKLAAISPITERVLGFHQSLALSGVDSAPLLTGLAYVGVPFQMRTVEELATTLIQVEVKAIELKETLEGEFIDAALPIQTIAASLHREESPEGCLRLFDKVGEGFILLRRAQRRVRLHAKAPSKIVRHLLPQTEAPHRASIASEVRDEFVELYEIMRRNQLDPTPTAEALQELFQARNYREMRRERRDVTLGDLLPSGLADVLGGGALPSGLADVLGGGALPSGLADVLGSRFPELTATNHTQKLKAQDLAYPFILVQTLVQREIDPTKTLRSLIPFFSKIKDNRKLIRLLSFGIKLAREGKDPSLAYSYFEGLIDFINEENIESFDRFLDSSKREFVFFYQANDLFHQLPIEDLSIGTQALIKFSIFTKAGQGGLTPAVQRELKDYIIPGLRIIEEITKNYPTLGMEINSPPDSKNVLSVLMVNFCSQVKTPHKLSPSILNSNQSAVIKLPPAPFPILYMFFRDLSRRKYITGEEVFFPFLSGESLQGDAFSNVALVLSLIPSTLSEELLAYHCFISGEIDRPRKDASPAEQFFLSQNKAALLSRPASGVNAWSGEEPTKTTKLLHTEYTSHLERRHGWSLGEHKPGLILSDLRRVALLSIASALTGQPNSKDPKLREIYLKNQRGLNRFLSQTNPSIRREIQILFSGKKGTDLKQLNPLFEHILSKQRTSRIWFLELQLLINEMIQEIEEHLFPEESLKGKILRLAIDQDFRGIKQLFRRINSLAGREREDALRLLPRAKYPDERDLFPRGPSRLPRAVDASI